MIPKN